MAVVVLNQNSHSRYVAPRIPRIRISPHFISPRYPTPLGFYRVNCSYNLANFFNDGRATLLQLKMILQIKWMRHVVIYESEFSLKVFYPSNTHSSILASRHSVDCFILHVLRTPTLLTHISFVRASCDFAPSPPVAHMPVALTLDSLQKNKFTAES
jgi:hypothetical protein